MPIQTTTRAANLDSLVELLRDHHARRLDIVAPVQAITASRGRLIVAGTEAEITDEGVTNLDGVYTPTQVGDDGIANRLGIPPSYLRKLRDQHIDVWDQNVNGWLTHPSQVNKKYLIRALRGDDQSDGVARAFLSDSYKPIDNLDILMAALDGIKQAGLQIEIAPGGCDLTDSRMYVKVWAPQVQQLAPVLLAGYRAPWGTTTERARRMTFGDQATVDDKPVVFSGFVIKNSEIGLGAFEIAPQIVIRICSNGQTITGEAMKRQHLGQKLAEGEIKWSDDTMQKSLALVTAQTRDAVNTFLSPAYLAAKVAEMERFASVEVADPDLTIKHVSSKLRYSEDRQADILRHFMLGGQATAGGVMQAVTSVAQITVDADEAAALEGDGIRALELAAALNS